MDMKIRDKHSALKGLIIDLEKKKMPLWRAVARGLNRPRRKAFEVNLYDLQHATGTVVVPGKVLGEGNLTKALTVAALGFSADAKVKITHAGGTTFTIAELMKKQPTGKGIHVMG